ncbi:MAG: hypothetical protein HOV94_05390 [Saccharothrix sp.]|nr:hypothetical protein [Saccharothrix sp.]
MDIAPGDQPFTPAEARDHLAELAEAFAGDPGGDLLAEVAGRVDQLDTAHGLRQARDHVAALLLDHPDQPEVGLLGLVAALLDHVDPYRVEPSGRLADVVELHPRTT